MINPTAMERSPDVHVLWMWRHTLFTALRGVGGVIEVDHELV
jgi:hypothetical protein